MLHIKITLDNNLEINRVTRFKCQFVGSDICVWPCMNSTCGPEVGVWIIHRNINIHSPPHILAVKGGGVRIIHIKEGIYISFFLFMNSVHKTHLQWDFPKNIILKASKELADARSELQSLVQEEAQYNKVKKAGTVTLYELFGFYGGGEA